MADGCEIEEGVLIENSVVGVRCKIGRDVTIRDSILLGNDDYESTEERTQAASDGLPPQGIGDGTVIERAIIDKNCRIGRNVRITNERGLESTEGTDLDTMQAVIRDRVVCIQRGASLPDNWSI